VKDFGRAFMNVAGTAKSVSEARSRKTHRKFYRGQCKKVPGPEVPLDAERAAIKLEIKSKKYLGG
jgi:hypothetical protein